MPQTTTLRINSIFEGLAPSQYFGQEGTFIASTAIDPDYPIVGSGIKTSGFCVPIGYAKFSGAPVNAAPVAIINNPKDTKTYTVLTNGKLISYDNAFGTETTIGPVAGSNASSGCYYNNYIYIFGTGASKDDVSRYGPLNNNPSLVDNVWKGAVLGTHTALTNTTYPTLQGVSIPNHVGFVAPDGNMYFTDFKNGLGLLHRISTQKVTDEGDTDGGFSVTGAAIFSAYQALKLPLGFYPTAITLYSGNLMIFGMYTIDGTITQGKSAFVMWDLVNTVTFFLGPVPLPDAYCTAALNMEGTVYIWTGNGQNGVRLSRYLGGEMVRDVAFLEEGLPPLAGAVDVMGNRLVWGGFTTNPNTRACVWAYGSKDVRLPAGIHNIALTSSTNTTTPFVTALRYVQQNSYKQPKVVIGWNDGSGSGLDQYSATGTLASNIRWMFNIGSRFQIQRIRIPLAGAVNSTTSITPTIYTDDLSTTASPALNVINNANYPSKRKAIYQATQLKSYFGDNNFVFELVWGNTNPLAVALPILIEIEIKDEEV